jgi:hypothetical protein
MQIYPKFPELSLPPIILTPAPAGVRAGVAEVAGPGCGVDFFEVFRCGTIENC